jgi:hypothetical protein
MRSNAARKTNAKRRWRRLADNSALLGGLSGEGFMLLAFQEKSCQ